MGAPFSVLLKMAGRNVLRNWRRSLASGLAITAGFTAVSLFDGFLKDLKFTQEDGFSSRGMLGEIIIQRKDAQYKLIEDSWKYSLTKDEQIFIEDHIAKRDDVDIWMRFLDVKGMISNGQNTSVFIGVAHDTQAGARMRLPYWNWNTLVGKPLQFGDDDNVILTGLGLGKVMECEPQVDITRVIARSGGYIPEERPFKCVRPSLQLSASTEMGQVNALDLKVLGIMDQGFREADQHWVQMPLTAGQRLMDTDKITMYTVRMKPGRSQAVFIQSIQEGAASQGFNFDVMPWRDHDFGAFIRNTNQILGTFKGIFMTIVVAIIVLSITNTMIKSVSERIREIGTLRSLGFFQTDIRRIFTSEGLIIAAVSCGLGLLLTILVSLAINYSGITYRAGLLNVPIFLSVGLNPTIWFYNSFWLCLLSAVTGWLASRQVARMVVADALRHS